MELEIVEGRALNRLYRQGRVAAHLLASPGRLLVAFPAGNAGAALFLSPANQLAVRGPITSVEGPDGMRGIAAHIVADSETLCIERALLGSLRGVRGHAAAEALAPDISSHADSVVLRRTMRDGHRVEVTLWPEQGTVVEGARFGARGPIAFLLQACTDEPPLSPIPIDALLASGVNADRRDLEALAFLAYEQKLLAGSWRFLSYFGRDTLLTLQLLMKVASERLIEAGLGAVLARLGPSGEVAHEEAIGEWPALSGEAPLDHGMVDDDFLLAPVLASYLCERAPQRSRELLAQHTPEGASFAEMVERNLELVVARASPYADSGALVAVRSKVGQWRDSLEGLGGGRFPYDVNVVLVPAALRAAARLGPLLGRATLAGEAARLLGAWRDVGEHFEVELAQGEAQERLDAFCAERGFERTLLDGPLGFPALALDDAGAPIPILHSDESFALIFDQPPAEPLVGSVERMLRPFPVGLWTPIGLVAANPAYAADAELRGLFTERHYHGTVVWSWQQALVALGLDRQLARRDLPHPVHARLRAARATLAESLVATRALAHSELWTFAVEDERMRLVPFGQAQGHADESNVVQLWSTVRLALQV